MIRKSALPANNVSKIQENISDFKKICFYFKIIEEYSLFLVTEAQNNIKRADEKLLSLANASAKRQMEFEKWNGTLAEKLQNLKDKIKEAKNTADGVIISEILFIFFSLKIRY